MVPDWASCSVERKVKMSPSLPGDPESFQLRPAVCEANYRFLVATWVGFSRQGSSIKTATMTSWKVAALTRGDGGNHQRRQS